MAPARPDPYWDREDAEDDPDALTLWPRRNLYWGRAFWAFVLAVGLWFFTPELFQPEVVPSPLRYVGYVGAALCAVGGVLFIRRAFWRLPIAILDQTGILDPSTSAYVLWVDVGAIWITERSHIVQVSIKLVPETGKVTYVGVRRSGRWFNRPHRRWMMGPIWWNVSDVDRPLDEVMADIMRLTSVPIRDLRKDARAQGPM